MALLLRPPVFQPVNSAGQPYAGGSLEFYLTGTSTPESVYSSENLSGASTTVTLDSAGRPGTDIFLHPSKKYKLILKDSAGNQVRVFDPVSTTDFAVVPLWSTIAGNPNGSLAGTASSSGVLPSMAWERTNNIMYVCTTTGAAAAAVWTAINPDTGQLVWTIADRVSAAPGAAAEGTSYIVSSSFGSFVTGQIITDNGVGEFTVTQPPTDCGWIAYVQDEDLYYSFQSTAWVANGLVPNASDTVVGKIEIAVQSEMEAGSSATLAVTAGRQHFHPGHPKAGGNFDGSGTPAFRAGDYGMGVITDNGSGDYTLAIDTAFANTNYWVNGWARNTDASDTAILSAPPAGTKTASALQVYVQREGSLLIDSTEVGISFWGDYA